MKSVRYSIQRGQSLPEYALIIVLAALAVIAILFVVGLGVQRIYGLVAGVLGTQHDIPNQHTIRITSAQCISIASIHQTGLWVVVIPIRQSAI